MKPSKKGYGTAGHGETEQQHRNSVLVGVGERMQEKQPSDDASCVCVGTVRRRKQVGKKK